MRSKCPKYYFDLGKEKRANEHGESFVSSSVAIIRALDRVLEHFEGSGLEKSIERCRNLQRGTLRALEIYNLTPYSKNPSPSLTAINVPASLDGQKWRSLLETSYNITLMGGQEQLKGKILRMGHIGDISNADHVHAIAALGLSLNDLGVQSISAGKIDLAMDVQEDFLKNSQK